MVCSSGSGSGSEPSATNHGRESGLPTPDGDLRARLTDVEATAAQVALFRYHAAQEFLRPDGRPYYDSAYDKVIVDRCLPTSEHAELLARHGVMVGLIVIRTAEIDEHIMSTVTGTGTWHSRLLTTGNTPSSAADSAGLGRGGGGGSDGGVSTPAVRQLVLVGAGLDARAWRLDFPAPDATAARTSGDGNGGGDGGMVVYELDSGTVEQVKEQVLGPPTNSRRVFVQADLAQADQALASLAAAGHQPSRPSVFVLEGLIGYLTREAGNRLLAGLRGLAAPGSLLLLTAPPTAAWRDELAARGTKLHHVTFEAARETEERARAAGWTTVLLGAEELGRKYGREDNRFELIVGVA